MEALKLVGLDRKANMLASAISLGEQKRLEVARALATALNCYCWMKFAAALPAQKPVP